MCQSSIPAMERLSFLRSQTYLGLLDFAEHGHVSRRVADLTRCRSPDDAGNCTDRHDLVLDSISAMLSSQISCSAAVYLIFRYAIQLLACLCFISLHYE